MHGSKLDIPSSALTKRGGGRVAAASIRKRVHDPGLRDWPQNGADMFLARTVLAFVFLFCTDSETLRHHNQVSQRFGTHFSHDVAPVNLDRPLAYTDFACNLLVHEAARHQRHDLALAG